MYRQTGSFITNDNLGNPHRIYIYTYVIDEGSGTESTGTVTLQTATGDRVNRLSKGEYKTLSGLVLRSTDPDAP
jgi:hypothetical protein